MGDRLIVVDCGNGVARQLVCAGLNPRDVSDLLITHHHVDHSADLGYLPLVAWIEGRTEKISIYGPPPTVSALYSILDGYADDLVKRTDSTGRPPFLPMLEAHDIRQPGVIFTDDQVRVTAARVDHPPFDMALGYRFDADGQSVVISGDTAPSSALIELARGADVLVHEVVHPEGLAGMQEATNAASLRQHLLKNHTMVEDLARVASAAEVKTLVLSHVLPHDLVDSEWLEAIGDEFSGEIIVGHDLLEIRI